VPQLCGLALILQLANEGVEKYAVCVVVEVVVTVTFPAVPTLPQVMLIPTPLPEIVNSGLKLGNCAWI
jgi:hypothetical protein